MPPQVFHPHRDQFIYLHYPNLPAVFIRAPPVCWWWWGSLSLQLPWSTRGQKMVRVCVCVCKFPNCSNKMRRETPCSFHRLPQYDKKRLRLWRAALKIDPNKSIKDLRLADYRVCNEHFDRDDYLHQVASKTPKHYYPKHTAVPVVVKPDVGAEVRL